MSFRTAIVSFFPLDFTIHQLRVVRMHLCYLLCVMCVDLFMQVHVNLLLMEARLQAALLYALRAITRYMT